MKEFILVKNPFRAAFVTGSSQPINTKKLVNKIHKKGSESHLKSCPDNLAMIFFNCLVENIWYFEIRKIWCVLIIL